MNSLGRLLRGKFRFQAKLDSQASYKYVQASYKYVQASYKYVQASYKYVQASHKYVQASYKYVQAWETSFSWKHNFLYEGQHKIGLTNK